MRVMLCYVMLLIYNRSENTTVNKIISANFYMTSKQTEVCLVKAAILGSFSLIKRYFNLSKLLTNTYFASICKLYKFCFTDQTTNHISKVPKNTWCLVFKYKEEPGSDGIADNSSLSLVRDMR